MNIDESTLQWLKDYLTDRTQVTTSNSTTSDECSVGIGVPQGSVLGPLLFLTYVNDVTKVIQHSSHYLYADDATLNMLGLYYRLTWTKLESGATSTNSLSILTRL